MQEGVGEFRQEAETTQSTLIRTLRRVERLQSLLAALMLA